MSHKNGSPPPLIAAAAEGSEREQPDGTRPQGRQGSRGEPTSTQNSKKPTQAGRLEPRLPSHRYSPSPGMLDRSLQAQLGRQLRAIYSDIAEEPVPERFVRLLEELEELEATEKRKEEHQ